MRLIFTGLIAVGLIALVGCSGISTEGSGNGDGSGGGDAASVGLDGGDRDSGSAAEGGSNQDLASGGGEGGVSSDLRLYPLVAGRRWTYVTHDSNYPSCPNRSHDVNVGQPMMVDGRSAFLVDNLCAGSPGYLSTTGGDVIDFDYQGTWYRTLDEPVVEGHMWSTLNATETWRSAGTVKVMAGTFPDCWTAHWNVSFTQEAVYCRGVGMVRFTEIDLNGGGFIHELAAKNF